MQIFLEPEGRNTPELYVQGFSTGLPEKLQKAMLHSLPGMKNCKMLRPAYAVEYDYLPAYQCSHTLETKRIEGLFFSGQLNGTTGKCLCLCLFPGTCFSMQSQLVKSQEVADIELWNRKDSCLFCQRQQTIQYAVFLASIQELNYQESSLVLETTVIYKRKSMM